MKREDLIAFAEQLSAKLSKDEVERLFLVIKSTQAGKFADEIYLTKTKDGKS